MRGVLHRLARRPSGRADRRADPEPTQEAQALTQDQQLVFDAIKREFPFMSDECILLVMSEL
jgi:hypothetical protein